MVRLTKAQRAALEIAVIGDLTRWDGGFWALADEPIYACHGLFAVPERYVAAGTIYALDRKRLLMELGHGHAHPWSGPRRITPAGRQALEAHHEQ